MKRLPHFGTGHSALSSDRISSISKYRWSRSITSASTVARSRADVPESFRNSTASRLSIWSLRRYSGETVSCLVSASRTVDLGIISPRSYFPSACADTWPSIASERPRSE